MSSTSFGRMAAMTFLLILLSGASAFAQGRGGNRGMDRDGFLEQQLTTINEAVGLSEAQTTALTALLGAQFDEQRTMMTAMMEARGSGGGDMGAMRQKLTDLRTKTDELIVAELTEEQVPKFTELREKQAAEQGQRRRRGMGGRPGPQ